MAMKASLNRFTVPGEEFQWRHSARQDELAVSSPNRQVLTTYFDGEPFVGLEEGQYDKEDSS